MPIEARGSVCFILSSYRPWYSYRSDRMRAFKQDIEDTKSIASEKQDDWIRNMSAGDENPAIALIFLRLHHLISLVIALSDREDPFMLQTLQRIAKDPHSSSLSRLRHVEICRISPFLSYSRSYDVQYLLACAALPSTRFTRSTPSIAKYHSHSLDTWFHYDLPTSKLSALTSIGASIKPGQ